MGLRAWPHEGVFGAWAGKGEASRPGGGQVFLAYTGWGGAVPVAENREIRQGKRYDFQREPSYGYSHLLL